MPSRLVPTEGPREGVPVLCQDLSEFLAVAWPSLASGRALWAAHLPGLTELEPTWAVQALTGAVWKQLPEPGDREDTRASTATKTKVGSRQRMHEENTERFLSIW